MFVLAETVSVKASDISLKKFSVMVAIFFRTDGPSEAEFNYIKKKEIIILGAQQT
jgi:hypothetical protein